MNTPRQWRLVLNKEEYRKLMGDEGTRQQAERLGLDRASVYRVLNRENDAVGTKFIAQLIAEAERAGISRGEAFERFFSSEPATAAAIQSAA